MSHWATQYIGKAWVRGAQGPDTFDCWGFVRYILSRHFNISVPELDIPDSQHEASKLMLNSPELQNWTQVQYMAEGYVVMMARRKVPLHIGLCIRANGQLGILHCAEPAGVLFQSLHGLQAAGFGRLTYYRHSPCE